MCPDCREPLVILELEGVEIDRCLACGGTWLDPGELERITTAAGVPPGGLSRAIGAAKSGRKSGRRCTRCRRKLRAVEVGKSNPIEIDRCPGGHGLWFDRGELEAVIASFAEGEEGAVARFFSEVYRKELKPEESKEEGA